MSLDRSLRYYLAGPIAGKSDSECRDWRNLLKSHFPNVSDPMDRDFRGQYLTLDDQIVTGDPRTVCELIVEGDKEAILDSDALLVYFPHPSVGTAMEILFAWENLKPVYVVDVSGKPLSPWILYHADQVFKSLEEAVE